MSVFCRFGRKRATQIPVVVMLVFTLTTGICPTYQLYLVSQFMLGIGYGGYRLNGIIMGKVCSFIIHLGVTPSLFSYKTVKNYKTDVRMMETTGSGVVEYGTVFF